MNGFSSGHDDGAGGGGSGNNNYVNFNQFIMQHNLTGGAGLNNFATAIRGAGSSSASTAGDTAAAAFGEGFFDYGQEREKGGSTTAAHGFQQQASNFYNPNSNLFPTAMLYTNGLDADGGGDVNGADSPYNNTTSLNFFDTFYTPFGNNGTTYYTNPFAGSFGYGLDGATPSTTLHASAPEFVPRFSNLSLNEFVDHDTQQQQQTHMHLKASTNGNIVPTGTTPITTTTTFSEPNDSERDNGSHASCALISNAKPLYNDAGLFRNMTTTTTATTGDSGDLSSTVSQADNGKASGNNNPAPLNTSNSRASVIVLKNVDSISGSGSSSSSTSPASTAMRHSTGATSKLATQLPPIAPQTTTTNQPMNANSTLRGPSATLGKGASNGHGRRGAMEHYERERQRDDGELRAGHHAQRKNARERDYHQQRYENHRNKRWDDHNRNRDRINGFRDNNSMMGSASDVYEGRDYQQASPLHSPEKQQQKQQYQQQQVSPKKTYSDENEKLSQREKLIRDIETRRLECLVCVEPIKAHQAVWSCHNCFHILHLQCIIKWACSSKSVDGWRCPACQNVVKDVPRNYYCFCGKLKNPAYNRQDVAHSCGELCGRIEGCTHACTLLCHPGPCPPCQAYVRRECGCGKTTRTLQCCLKEAFVCDAACGKQLNCEQHMCAEPCHEGKCSPCTAKVPQQCHCAKQDRQVTCTRDTHDKHSYSCGKACGRDLTCGNHKCKDCCHAGDCRPCKLSPAQVTSCPCGKMPLVVSQRESCLDPIPVCDGICGKTLRCGKAAHPHHCTSKCHLGNCPPCNKQTAVKCRCGHMDQLIKCRQLSTRADDARCKKRCVKKRSCGKHKCNQECCIDIDHICPLPCTYTLSCGKHKCDQSCHRGNCAPCYRSSFEELYCECGAEVIYPPVPCGTKRPLCKRPCSRSHPCEHPPQHHCHAAASCPPCMMFTTKWCYGHHEQRKTIPCSQQSFSCGLACQKPLTCGRHKCIKTCHQDACQTAGEVCKQSCTVLRVGCGHKCMAPCHDGDCPDTPCKELVEVQCECGNRKQQRSCADLSREYSRIATAQLASSMAEMQRGNYMELSEILAPVKINKTNKTLDCNEECRLLERNRRLAIGLQTRNPDVPQKLLTKYSDFIRNFAKRDAALVKSIHDSLTTLVKLAKESKQKSRSHSFPTMNREKRQLVHEMCEMFGVDSVAYDAEPNRNVVATAQKDRSWLPATSIMEVMQREAGQRRVPVPSNNAWGLKR